MSKIVLKTGQVMTTHKVESYFRKLFRAQESGEEFPVDADDVWAFAYSTKANFLRALRSSKFKEGIDFRNIIRTDDISDEPTRRGPRVEKYFLTTQCMEHMIAREVDELFEVYRQCRIKVTELAKEKLKAPSERARRLAAQGRSKEFINIREKFVPVRLNECAALTERGICEPKDFAILTDAQNRVVLGKSAREFKAALNLPKSADTRDHMTIPQLGLHGVIEAILPEVLEKANAQGLAACIGVVENLAGSLKDAMLTHGIDTQALPGTDVA